MKDLSVDIETYSDIDIGKAGLYRYCDTPDFEVLLFAYAEDFGDVKIIDLAQGEQIPPEILAALKDKDVIKRAYNAAFEITCLNRAGYETPPEQWRCTMLHGMYLGYPAGLAKLGGALGLPEGKKKMGVGKALIRYFCVPCTPTKSNGSRTRNLPKHDSDKWNLFKEYCRQDVVTEIENYKRLRAFPVPEDVQADWVLDYEINSRGIAIDTELVNGALAIDEEHRNELTARAVKITGLTNPNSRTQLLAWLNENTTLDLENLTKATVAANIDVDDKAAAEILNLRRELSKSSVSKYKAMSTAVCSDGRVRGLLQYYGASRTGRWAGRLVQVQNLPRNYIENLDTARGLVKTHNRQGLMLLYGNDVADTLSQLIRTAFIAPEGSILAVADFSAIEARVLSWLAGERWRLDVFAGHGKIYEAAASMMFGVQIEKISKGNPEYALRQKGKIAELACIAEGQMVLTDKGLIAIENVTTDMKVYDGEEFVNHEGVIYKGKREVITYDGLTATEDHLVWVEGQSEPVSFGYAAASGSRLKKYTASRENLWEDKDNFTRTSLRKRLGSGTCSWPLRKLWKNRMGIPREFNAGQISGLPTLQSTEENSKVAGQAIYCGKTALHQPKRCKLQKLRRTGHKIFIFFCTRSGALDDRTLRATWKRNGNRPHRCKWELRTRKFTLDNTSRKLPESETLSVKKVYDILNCGTKNRFIVNGVLVHNCGYQGGIVALKAMGADKMGLSDEYLSDIITRWRKANKRICDFWYRVEQAAISVMQTAQPAGVDHGIIFFREMDAVNGLDFLTVQLPSGRKLYYPSPYLAENKFGKSAIHYRTQIGNNWSCTSTYGGKLVENITQAVARDCLAVALRRLVTAGYKPLMHIHDEVVCEVPVEKLHLDEEAYMTKIMCEPISWAPGLILNAAGFTSRYYMKD